MTAPVEISIPAAVSRKRLPNDRTRPGVLSAPSIWWSKLVPGGRNANSTTSEESRTGGGAAAYTTISWMFGWRINPAKLEFHSS
jgi:hypothetical protein